MRVPGVLAGIAAALIAVAAPAASALSAGQHHGNIKTNSTAGRTHATFGAGPASKVKVPHLRKRQFAIDGRPYYTFDTSPGGQINDHIGIVNLTHHKQALNVYTVDATSDSGGDFSYPPRSVKPTQAGAWLAVGTPHGSGQLVVKPRSKTYLPVHLRVPSNAQPGDHAGAVIVSSTALVKSKSKTGQRVHLEQRVATRVIVRVSGTLHPQLSVQGLHIHYSSTNNPIGRGSATVTYTVANTGNVLLGATQQVDVKGWFGTSAHAPTLAGIPALLPGGTVPVSVTVPNVFPAVHLTASVQLVPAGLRGAVDPGLHPVNASASVWAIPWILLAIIVALIAVVAFEVARRRRRKRAPTGQRVVTTSSPGTAIGEGATS